MLTIWKAILRMEDRQAIEVPAGAEILSAREQFDQICIWFRCDPEAKKEPRNIAVVGTGHPAPIDGRYLGLASLHAGNLIFHVFELSQ